MSLVARSPEPLAESVDAGRRHGMRSYRTLAKVLHWLTAGLVVCMVTSGLMMKQIGGGALADTLFSLHKATGALMLTIVLMRFGYRVIRLEPGWRAATYRRPLLHWTLYAVVITVPLLGWAGISDYGAREILPGYSLPAIWPEGAGYADLLFRLHAYVAFGLLALVALHIGIAMQDHLTRARDDVAHGD